MVNMKMGQMNDMVLFVKCFNCYIKKHGLRRSDKSSRRSQTKGKNGKDENGPSCFGCGKVDHLRRECPNLTKSKGKVSSSES